MVYLFIIFINLIKLKNIMRFTFSPLFRGDIYNRFLVELGVLLEEQRVALGCNVRFTKSTLHVGFGILKKYRQASLSNRSITWH